MTDIMMMLGPYPFTLNTAAYQQLTRASTYRWKQLDRIGKTPAQQYVGPGADQITLNGEILPHWRGGFDQLDQMRAQAKRGKPLKLIDGHGGYVLGNWVVTRITETKSELQPNGAPGVIKFSMTLKEYGGSAPSALELAGSVLSTLARLV